MGTWTNEAERAIELCLEWAKELTDDYECELYLFGSAIYKDGVQFDPIRSDLDIICLLPDSLQTADDRWYFIQDLKERKLALELEMIPRLGRTVCDEPGVSLVPITTLELKANIHKSGARRFFDKNLYLNLRTGEPQLSLRDAGVLSIADEPRQAMEYVQGVRNNYLALAANEKGGIRPYRGQDPLPKALMRSAAQVSKDAQAGEWYDTRFGLELLHRLLSARRLESEVFRRLFDDKLSVLRGGRGREDVELSAEDQLLLAEILFDECAAIETPSTVSWELDLLGGVTSDEMDALRLTRIQQLAHGAYRIGGTSRTPQYRGSTEALTILQELSRAGALAGLLRVERASIRSSADIEAPLDASTIEVPRLLDLLLARIEDWRPSSQKLSGHSIAGEFGDYLRAVVIALAEGSPVEVSRESTLEVHPRIFDFVVTTNEGYPIAIELTRFQSLASLGDELLEFAEMPIPMVFVFYGVPQKVRHAAETAASRFRQINSNVQTVLIFLEDADSGNAAGN